MFAELLVNDAAEELPRSIDATDARIRQSGGRVLDQDL